MNATLERLSHQFVQLIGPTAVAAIQAAPAPAAVPHGTATPAPTSGAGPRPAVPLAIPPTAAASPAVPAAAAKPAMPPAPTGPVQITDQALKGFQFDATVDPAQVVDAASILDREGFAIDAVTGVDWIAQNQMEVVYDYFHPVEGLRAVVRARVNRAQPELPTISTVFPGANWHERETHDFFGIRFAGHPNLTPFLLPEDATFHPLRKDYQP